MTPFGSILGRVDEKLFAEEANNISQSAAQLTSSFPHVIKLEPFKSDKGNDARRPCEEIATFDCNFTIIPDSPCSESSEPSIDLHFTTAVKQVEKIDLEVFRADNEDFKLEPMLLKDETISDISEARSKGLRSLVERLREEPVADPLAICSHLMPLESFTGSKKEKLSDIQSGEDNSPVTYKECKKYEVYPSTEELENVIVKEELTVQTATIMNVCLKLATIPKIPLEINHEISCKEILAKVLSKDQQPRLALETPKPVPITRRQLSVFEINDIADEEVDTFCDSAILDSPVIENSSLEVNNIKAKQKALYCSPLSSPQSHICLLDDKEKQVLEESCLTHEYLRDPKQSARLPVPNIPEIQISIASHSLVKDLHKTFNVSADRDIGKLDLDLPWTLIHYSTLAVNKLEDLPGNACVKQDARHKQEPVILCQKYTKEEISEQVNNAIQEVDPQTADFSQIKPDGKNCKIKEIKEVIKSVPKVEIKVKEKTSDFDFDPLGDFMALRSKVRDTINIEAEHCNEPIPIQVKETDANQKQLKQKPSTRRSNKHHVVNVQLTEEFEAILDMLEESAVPYLQQLRKSGDLSPSTTFSTLSPDSALFIVKQKEKYIRNSGGKGVSVDSYRATVCLYALSQAADYVACSCLESTISFLSAVLEEYQVVKNSAIFSVLKMLVDKLTEFSRTQVSHPKVLALCQEVETWLRKKRAKSGDHEQRILVLVKEDMSSLLNCLKSAISCSGQLSPDILRTAGSEEIIQSLDSHNCLIAPHRYVQDTFPWAQFCLVVEYEYVEGSEWQTVCQRQNIRHIGIQQQPTHMLKKSPLSTSWIPSVIDHQIKVIASSERIISNTELLQLLEGKHNMVLIERDYRRLACHNNLVFSDFDIDEETCIILADLQDLQDDSGIQNIIKRLMVMSLKYTKCFCILTSIKRDNRYELPGPMITNQSRLKATVVNMCGKISNFHVKIIQCSSISELASVIRCISEQCMPAAESPQSTNQWLNRPWIQQDVTKEEQFLLMIPCLSSYNAQLILNKLSIKKLLKLSSGELETIFPNIPERTIKSFVTYINSIRGLQLQRDIDYEDSSDTCVKETTVMNQLDSCESLNQPSVSENNLVEQNTESLDFSEDDVFEDVLRKRRYHRKLVGKQDTINEKPMSYHSQLTNEISIDPDLTESKKFVSGSQRMTESGDSAKNLTLSSKLNIMRENSSTNPSGDFYHKVRDHEFDPYYNKNNRSQYHPQRHFPETAEKQHKIYGDKGLISEPNTSNMIDLTNDTYSTKVECNKVPSAYEFHRHLEPFDTQLSGNYMSKNQKEYRKALARPQAKQISDTSHPQRLEYPDNSDSFSTCLSLPIETYDYNHGLGSTTTHMKPTIEDLSKQTKYPRPVPVYKRFNMAQLEREFPTSEELDALDLTPRQENLDRDTSFKYSNRKNQNRDYSDIDLNNTDLVYEDVYTTQTNHDVHQEQIKSVGFNLQPKLTTVDSFGNSSFDLLSDRQQQPAKMHTNTHKPIGGTEDKENAPPSLRSQYTGLYLNPNLNRVSLRANFLKQPEQPSCNEKHSDFNWGLANDLRETTRRFLENSQQFSKLGTPNSRRPPLRVNIGLAQPLPRTNQVNNTGSINRNRVNEPLVERTERQLMEQSMWTTKGSPPMDLEEDDLCPPTLHADTFNREVFSYQTPKKRKLTYQRAPGKRGQTTLVFS